MGIQYLNRFLKEKCKESIKFISLSELSGKKIAVDISIYIYRYASDNNLIENIYLMLSIFRFYNIIPVFIFDGKPPAEKKELLIKRIQDKKKAECEYKRLKDKLDINNVTDDGEKQEIIESMDVLKKQFVYISKTQLEEVKHLIRGYGASYYDAHGEADALCAKLVLNGKVWGCLSEDMDMFVYGVNRVIRYFSLLNHTAVLYNTEGILHNLNISQKELREICVLSGTDYNIQKKEDNCKTPNLYKTLQYFKRYRMEGTQMGFYDWLLKNTEYIENHELLQKICCMFDLVNSKENDSTLAMFDNITIEYGPIMKSCIKEILKKDGFIFPIEK
jgi:flap endonuclease-1